MTTFLHICGGILGLVLLYYGAEWLVAGGVTIARRLKISPLVIGLTLVAFGTSAPELVVSISASLSCHGDVSIGNVVGSNICNIALILGLCAVVSPLVVNPKLFRLDMPVLLGASLLMTGFYRMSGGITRWQGSILFFCLLIYTGWLICKGRKEEQPPEESSPEASSRGIPLSLLMVGGGLAALVCGGNFFVDSAVHIARLCSVPEAVIGLTVVAVGTSLPELATSLVAAFRKETDIAIGNVVGSNIFNLLSILGITPIISPISAPGISMIDLGVMLFLVVILFPIMRTGYSISRREGLLLTAIYIAYTVWLVIG